jgi:Flp pilus assembly pilin Flp
MKNWIMNFIRDERGAESTEMAVTTVVVAGGAVVGYQGLQGAIADKNTAMVDSLDKVAPSNAVAP